MKKQIYFIAALATVITLSSPLAAIEQRFGLSDEANTMPKGKWGFSSSLQLEHDAENDGYAFSHDLFYGLSNQMEMHLIASRWSILSGDGEAADGADQEAWGGEGDGESQTNWDSAGFGVGYTILDPRQKPFGAAFFSNVLMGGELFALEEILALQKNFGKIALLYNGVVEAEWTGDDLGNLNSNAGEITHSLGISVPLGGGFHVGVETLFEISLPDWSNPESALFAGPNVSFQKNGFFGTIAPLFQVTNNSEYEDLQLGVRVGFNF